MSELEVKNSSKKYSHHNIITIITSFILTIIGIVTPVWGLVDNHFDQESLKKHQQFEIQYMQKSNDQRNGQNEKLDLVNKNLACVKKKVACDNKELVFQDKRIRKLEVELDSFKKKSNFQN